ncbi:hypothetical protein MW887_008025 [Aspergillus wentii]|nr:hypothetical protein MW887_008025 [Aspergillus wentii]
MGHSRVEKSPDSSSVVEPVADDSHKQANRDESDTDTENGNVIISRGDRETGMIFQGITCDLSEYSDDDGGRECAFFIGPTKSLFWLAGYDELVEAIDDPAYVIQDEIRVIPQSTGIGFLVDQYFEEGKIPRDFYHRSLGYNFGPGGHMPPAMTTTNPSAITTSVSSHKIEDIYPMKEVHLPRLATATRDSNPDGHSSWTVSLSSRRRRNKPCY